MAEAAAHGRENRNCGVLSCMVVVPALCAATRRRVMSITKKIFKTKSDIIPTIAQLLIVVILLPPICYLLSFIMGERAFDFVKGLLDEFPLTKYWTAIIYDFDWQKSFSTLSGLELLAAVIKEVGKVIFEASIVGMVISMCKEFGNLLKFNGLPLLQSVIGVVLGCLLLRSIQFDGMNWKIIVCVVLAALTYAVHWLTSEDGFLKSVLKASIEIGFDTFIAGLISGYTAFLSVILNNSAVFTDFSKPFFLGLFILLPSVIFIALNHLLTGKKD
ncbi:MAG: hypothetical protein IKM84_08485 [Oscillospiraceae bacterium]|nr:hypothetical protein [Oscillospiraceae bacterium]